MNTHASDSGFTLIELSVVLVIIGLIVGGVLVGQDLIKAAQIRGTISAMERYKVAYNDFLNKYTCAPGDCTNGQQLGFVASNQCNSSGIPTAYSNGSGDGYIYTFNDSSTLPSGEPLYCEGFNALAALYQAGLIGYGASYRENDSNIPLENGFMFFTSLRPNSPPPGYVMPDRDTNYLYIGTTPGSGSDFEGIGTVLTPAESLAIDTKMDDGLPMSGSVRASYQSVPGNCVGMTMHGPCFNNPSTWTGSGEYQQCGGCVNASTTPYTYNVAFGPPTSKTLSACSAIPYQGYCSIHAPVN